MSLSVSTVLMPSHSMQRAEALCGDHSAFRDTSTPSDGDSFCRGSSTKPDPATTSPSHHSPCECCEVAACSSAPLSPKPLLMRGDVPVAVAEGAGSRSSTTATSLKRLPSLVDPRDEFAPSSKKPKDARQASPGCRLQTDSNGSFREPSTSYEQADSPFEGLPDDLVSVILGHAAERSDSPGSFINMLMTSRRMCFLGGQAQVLRRIPFPALAVSAGSWSDASFRFLHRCFQAGNVPATYSLGMIAFYCLKRPSWGMKLLAQAALGRSAEALYSLAIMHFNGSGAMGSRPSRDVRSGVLLCMQAANMGHVDAMRELGHCLQDGYGVQRDLATGRQLLIKANLRESAQALGASFKLPRDQREIHQRGSGTCCRSSCSQHQCSHQRAHQAPSESYPERSPLIRTMSAPSQTCGGSSLTIRRHWLGRRQGAGAWVRPRQARHQPRNDHGGHRHDHNHNIGRIGSQLAPADAAPAAAASAVTSSSGQQCFCLPTVTLPLQALPDGWVRMFLIDWHGMEEVGHLTTLRFEAGLPFEEAQGMPMACSNELCGRKELRDNEFRCCSACSEARYCSRVCQAVHWKHGHKVVCETLAQLQLQRSSLEAEPDVL